MGTGNNHINLVRVIAIDDIRYVLKCHNGRLIAKGERMSILVYSKLSLMNVLYTTSQAKMK